MRLQAKILIIASLLGLASCGFPGNEMTPAERQSDMEWAFTVFDHNYAPADLKKDNFGVVLSGLRADCVEAAKQEDVTNDDFIALFHKCVHTVKDAHVGASQMNNGLLPEFATVAHLGFATMRTIVDGKNALRVTGVLPLSIDLGEVIAPGSLITAIDGAPVEDHLLTSVIPFIDVGHDEANLSIAGFRFSIRSSLDQGLPKEETITLTVSNPGAEPQDITLYWVLQDQLDFIAEIEAAQAGSPQGSAEELEAKAIARFGINPFATLSNSVVGYSVLEKLFKRVTEPLLNQAERLQALVVNGFQKISFNPIMNKLFDGELDEGETAQAIANRDLMFAQTVEDLMPEPMIPAKLVTTEDGQQYAYIQITGFPGSDEFVAEVKRAIDVVIQKEIKGLIVDMLDNGGGSLVHGMRLANLFRKQKLALPQLQVKLNNNWVNSFKAQASFGTHQNQVKAKRVLKDLEADMEAGLSISRPFSVAAIDPVGIQANTQYGLADDVKVALLVNEFCVSMCDIFAGVLQDNKMAKLIGARSMGGGGNVTQHALSPVSKFMISMTESLVVRSNGKYIEDLGVTPDIKIETVPDRETGFSKTLDTAYKYVTGQI